MDIAFLNKPIRKICENQDVALEHYGEFVAKRLKRRLADIHAAKHLNQLAMLIPGLLETISNGIFTMQISDNCQLLFQPNHTRLPYLPTGQIDLDKVSYIKIISINIINE